MSNLNGNDPEDEVVSGNSMEQKKGINADSDANQNVPASLGESSGEDSKESEAHSTMKTEASEPVNPWAGPFGKEMSPAIITRLNCKTGKKIDPGTDANASKAVVEENWDQFYMDHSIDELHEVVRLTSAEKDLAQAFSIKLSKETNGTTGIIESGGLGPNRLSKIGAIIEHEVCIDTQIQLLDILIKIWNSFNDALKISIFLKLLISFWIIDLTIVKEETKILDEFQLLMTLSKWADKAMELAKKVEAIKIAEAEREQEVEAMKLLVKLPT